MELSLARVSNQYPISTSNQHGLGDLLRSGSPGGDLSEVGAKGSGSGQVAGALHRGSASGLGSMGSMDGMVSI